MLIKHTCFEDFIFNEIGNSTLTLERVCVWAFQYVTQFRNWQKASLPWFSHRNFHKLSMAIGKDTDCWKAPFSKEAMLKVKRDLVSDPYICLSSADNL